MIPNAWTVGHTENYNNAISQNEEPIQKLGRNDPSLKNPYDGGCVFRTPEDAQRYIKLNKLLSYSVYGLFLLNGWDNDVDDDREQMEGFCRLINTSPITGIWID
jgi:hypothetical protein